MILDAFRGTAAALAFACIALAGCTGDLASAAVATDRSAVAAADAPAPRPESIAVDAAVGQGAGETCDEDDIACHELFHQLEETLFLYESGIANQLEAPARACWQSDGESFQRTLDACDDNACRETALRKRIAGLHSLQPSENRSALDLPEAPELIAVLGPDDGTAARPDVEAPVPFEARGGPVHAMAHPEHMGIAVQGAGGEDHVIIFDMDIGSEPGHDEVLGLVGTSPTAKVLVRGDRRMAADGIANFDTSRCRLAYLLP